MQLTDEQPGEAYRSMCTIREFGKRMRKEFTTRQIRGLVCLHAGAHGGHGHSIGKGAES